MPRTSSINNLAPSSFIEDGRIKKSPPWNESRQDYIIKLLYLCTVHLHTVKSNFTGTYCINCWNLYSIFAKSESWCSLILLGWFELSLQAFSSISVNWNYLIRSSYFPFSIPQILKITKHAGIQKNQQLYLDTFTTMRSVHLYYNQNFYMESCDGKKYFILVYMKIKPAQILKTTKMSLLVPAARWLC